LCDALLFWALPFFVACSFNEIRKDACFILGLLAVKPEYQHQIAAARALPGEQ
jgi:hypothetical protein